MEHFHKVKYFCFTGKIPTLPNCSFFPLDNIFKGNPVNPVENEPLLEKEQKEKSEEEKSTGTSGTKVTQPMETKSNVEVVDETKPAEGKNHNTF